MVFSANIYFFRAYYSQPDIEYQEGYNNIEWIYELCIYLHPLNNRNYVKDRLSWEMI